MSTTFCEISLIFDLNVSFLVGPPLHFPRNLHVTPLPKAVSLHCAPIMIIVAQSLICNGNRTEWSPIRSVIIQVIAKSDDRAAGVRCLSRV